MDIPKIGKWQIIGVTAGIVVAWRFMSNSKSSDAGAVVQTGYDPQLVALGTEVAGKQAELDTTLKLAQLSADTEVKTGMMTNELARYGIDSGERIAGQQFALDNSRLAVENSIAGAALADAQQERVQAYNLANYQTMVQHDLGKKGIKAEAQAGILNTVSNGLLKYLGK